jgi:glycine cleavage system regulatory protein
MQTDKLIVFIADDRPGLVGQIAEVVIAHGGNWLESRMSQLAGKFTGLVRVSLPQESLADFERALGGLEQVGILLRLENATGASAAPAMSPWRLEIIGNDRPGIVHEFATALARRQINVLDMRTDVSTAPMSAGLLFSATADIHVPASIDIDELHESLEALADELTIEYTLEPSPD